MIEDDGQIRNDDEVTAFPCELSVVDVADRPLEHADDADVVSVGMENYDLMDVSITATARPPALAGRRMPLRRISQSKPK
jgi:hypothetical protein